MFGHRDSIQKFFPDHRIEHLEIDGLTYGDAPERYHHRISSEENLFTTFFTIWQRLATRIEIPFKLDGPFADTEQGQVIAAREAFVNLLMHADYFSGERPRVRVFADRIEFNNGGGLPKRLEFILKEDYSHPRNKVVARIFRLVRLAEGIGSGFHKMFKGWEEFYKAKPTVEYDIDRYKITFPLTKLQETANNRGLADGLADGLAESQKRMLALVAATPRVSKKKLSEELGISLTAVDKNRARLKELGLLRRIGTRRSGHWEVSQEACGKKQGE